MQLQVLGASGDVQMGRDIVRILCSSKKPLVFLYGEQLPAVLQGKCAFYFWMGAALWVAGLGGSLCTRIEGLQGVCRGP